MCALCRSQILPCRANVIRWSSTKHNCLQLLLASNSTNSVTSIKGFRRDWIGVCNWKPLLHTEYSTHNTMHHCTTCGLPIILCALRVCLRCNFSCPRAVRSYWLPSQWTEKPLTRSSVLMSYHSCAAAVPLHVHPLLVSCPDVLTRARAQKCSLPYTYSIECKLECVHLPNTHIASVLSDTNLFWSKHRPVPVSGVRSECTYHNNSTQFNTAVKDGSSPIVYCVWKRATSWGMLAVAVGRDKS